jgi:hypothetical protein
MERQTLCDWVIRCNADSSTALVGNSSPQLILPENIVP